MRSTSAARRRNTEQDDPQYISDPRTNEESKNNDLNTLDEQLYYVWRYILTNIALSLIVNNHPEQHLAYLLLDIAYLPRYHPIHFYLIDRINTYADEQDNGRRINRETNDE